MLITLSLVNDGVLKRPLLYPSLYFEEHRQDYDAQLTSVRETGDYEQWIDFFAEAIRHSAEVAIETGRRISKVFRQDREVLRQQGRVASEML